MKVDWFFIRCKFPVYAIELQIPKYYSSISSRINKGKKNVIIGEKRSKLLKRGNVVLEKKTPGVALKNSALREQDQKRSTRSTKTRLESGSYGNFVKKSQKQEEGVAEL